MTTQHTAGPWLLGAGPIIYAANEEQIADLRDAESEAQQGANARLIAAAPELLEALRYYVAQHESHLGGMPEHNPNDGKVWDRTLKLAKVAIAKAAQ